MESKVNLRISHFGVRNGEHIIASPSGSQCKGSDLELRSASGVPYPPSRVRVHELLGSVVRDELNNYEFFAPLTQKERQDWLEGHAQDNDDLHVSDLAGVFVKIHSLSGKLVTEQLRAEQIDTLLAGNPADPDGFWPIEYLYHSFPRRPGSRAARHVLFFRPGNWILKPVDRGLREFNGPYFRLSTGAPAQ